MKKHFLIIITIISLILAILTNIFLNNIISLIFFSITSAIITFKLYTEKNDINEIAESNLKAISFVLTFILLSVLLFSLTMIIKDKIHFKPKIKEQNIPVELVAISTYDTSTSDLSFQTFSTKRKDTSVIIVKNNSDMIFRNSNFEKKGGESTNCDYSNNYGLNSVYLNRTGSSSKIYSSTIISEENCSIPLYNTDESSFIEVNDTKIESKSSYNSSAIVVANKSELKANNITVLSKGKYSSAVKTLENSKTNIINSLLETSSNNAPLIYNEGTTELKNITGTANQDRFLLLKGGELSLDESTILTSGRGEDIKNHSAIKIVGDSTLNVKNSSINVNKNGLYYNVSSMFIIEDAKTIINIEKSILNTGSNTFIKANNSTITINLKNQSIKGNIISNNSNITLNLEKSTYEGDLNNTIVYLDETSTITLTKDTVLKELHNKKSDNSNIILNGHTLRINK